RAMEQWQGYVDSLTTPLGIEVQEGAVQNARDLGANVDVRLRGRAASRPLVTYSGGELTAEELLRTLRTLPQSMLGQLGGATDEDIGGFLEGLTQNEILVAEAARAGFVIQQEATDSAVANVRSFLAQAANEMGLADIQPQDGETMNEAIERRVNAYLHRLLRGEPARLPQDALGLVLRPQFDIEVNDRA